MVDFLWLFLEKSVWLGLEGLTIVDFAETKADE